MEKKFKISFHAVWKNVQKLISVKGQIRSCRAEVGPKLNKLCSTFIRHTRVDSLGFFPCMAQVQPMPNKILFKLRMNDMVSCLFKKQKRSQECHYFSKRKFQSVFTLKWRNVKYKKVVLDHGKNLSLSQLKPLFHHPTVFQPNLGEHLSKNSDSNQKICNPYRRGIKPQQRRCRLGLNYRL